jgi:hypothetical protein
LLDLVSRDGAQRIARFFPFSGASKGQKVYRRSTDKILTRSFAAQGVNGRFGECRDPGWPSALGRERHSRSRVVHGQNDHSFCGGRAVHVNAMSTRIRRFGAVGDGENTSMSVGMEMENRQNQRLGA